MNQKIIKVSIIGLLTGLLACFVGGGAEILIVPLLYGLMYLKIIKEQLEHH